MLSPALLVVFVMSGARVESTTLPFERAAYEVLGPSAELRVEEVASLPSDAVALERAGAADGVVELSWDAAQQTAVLHCYIASERRWVDRTIQFGAADRQPDRGRLLGFAVAAMFIDAPSFLNARAREQTSIEPAAASAPVSASAPVIASRADLAASGGQPRAGFEEAPAGPFPSRVQLGGERRVEFAGVVTNGFGTAGALELGALAALGVPLSDPLSVRIQLEGRQTGGEARPRRSLRDRYARCPGRGARDGVSPGRVAGRRSLRRR
jgi:hypothetical protein